MGTRVGWDFSMHPFYDVFIFESHGTSIYSKQSTQTNRMPGHNPILRKAESVGPEWSLHIQTFARSPGDPHATCP